MLTDRQRVGLLLPVQVMLTVLVHGVDDPEHEDAKLCRELLVQASEEPLGDLPPDKKVKVMRRVLRLHDEVSRPYTKEGMRADKYGLIAYYWLKALTDADYLILGAESAFSKALDLFLPAIGHVTEIEKVDKSAQKNARKFLTHLQRLGYYTGVGIVDAA